MSCICHTLCLFEEANLNVIITREFEQTRFKHLPILKSDNKGHDVIADFVSQYIKNRNGTNNYNENVSIDAKTGFRRNNNIIPMMENSVYPYIKYLQLTKNGIVYVLIYSTSYVDSDKFFCDVDCFKAFQYLDNLDDLLSNFFTKNYNVKQLRANKMVLNEIIDETLDFGIPQLTDYNLLHQYIKLKIEEEPQEFKDKQSSNSQIHNLKNLVMGNEVDTNIQPDAASSAPKEDIYLKSKIIETLNDSISWRPKGIHYKKNELFVDVIEKVKFIQDLNKDSSKSIKYHQVEGSIMCKSYLSGMPVVQLGLINDMTFNIDRINQKGDEFKFHQCIQKIDTDYYQNKDGNKLVTFIPPDGEFELCNYRFDILKERKNDERSEIVQIVEFTKTFKERSLKKLKMPSMKMNLKIKTYFKKNLVPEFLRIKIPLKSFIDDLNNIDLTFTPKFKTDFGTIIYNLSDDFLIWDCKNIKGNYGEKIYECHVQFQMVDDEIMKLKKEELKKQMDAPPLRSGPKLEKIYDELQTTNSSTIYRSEKVNRNIQVEFEIPYFVVSGLKIDFIKVDEKANSKYQFFSWIRYKTENQEDGYKFNATARLLTNK